MGSLDSFLQSPPVREALQRIDRRQRLLDRLDEANRRYDRLLEEQARIDTILREQGKVEAARDASERIVQTLKRLTEHQDAIDLVLRKYHRDAASFAAARSYQRHRAERLSDVRQRIKVPLGANIAINASQTAAHDAVASSVAKIEQELNDIDPEYGSAFGPAQPTIVLPIAIIDVQDGVDEGKLITACSIPWLAIVREIERDPEFLFRFVNHPDNFEEFLAASYDEAGFQVILTPRSGDLGRDIIATARMEGLGAVRIYDQAKAYSPKHRVPANDVRAMLGIINRDKNVSKGIVTTCSAFAPGVWKEFAGEMPTRLELRDGPKLLEWLVEIAKKNKAGAPK